MVRYGWLEYDKHSKRRILQVDMFSMVMGFEPLALRHKLEKGCPIGGYVKTLLEALNQKAQLI